MTRAGIATVVGKPNAGKSTLLNHLIGQKLSITSAKPQSTRDRVVGIRSEGESQMIVLDTPGLLTPRYELHRAMRGAALQALQDADVVLYLHDANEGPAPTLVDAAELERVPSAPVILVLNKVDLVSPGQRDALAERHPDARFISAKEGTGVVELIADVEQRLPESPFLYPADEISTQPMKFFVSELVRETALDQLEDEVPYSVACEIEQFREDRTPLYIRAVIYVERESQKGILIGAKGARIRDIGAAARAKIETLVDGPVYLDLRIKVLANWRRNARSMQRFGYRVPKD